MKKRRIIMVIALLLTITVSVAQQLDLMPFHYVDVNSQVEGYEVLNLMRQRDGDYVSKSAIAYDVVFYKVSPTSLEITDSLCIHHQDGMGWYDMIAQDPRGEGNLCVTTVPDDEGGVNLRISHFNDNSFVVDPSEDIVVPLCDREILYYSEGMIDCRGDIIWKYYPALTDSTWESHFARIGLDGTLKHDATLTPDGIFIDFGVFSEQPLRYYQWMGDENLMLFMYDSLFQQENYYVINKGFHPEYDPSLVYFEFSSYTWNKSFLIPDEGDVLVAATYNDFSSGPGWPNYDDLEVGTAVARYDLRTMQQKGFVMFNDYPGPENGVMNLGFFKSSNGSLYLIYKEKAWDEHFHEISLPIAAVKMDQDLNVLWKHYIYMPKDFAVDGVDRCIMTEDENEVKIVCTGGCTKWDYQTGPWTHTEGLYYFFLTDDDPLETDEGEIRIRPYGFWPNPAHDQLCLQYSPDVQPTRIELYDLQGRLVRTQTTSFESLSMEGLAAGQYVLKVTLENGKTYSDKVIKQ